MNILKFILWALPTAVSAQVADYPATEVGAVSTLCEQLRLQGHVSLQQDARLDQLLSRNSRVYNAASRLLVNKNGDRVIVSPGFRVRVFSGNNQLNSKNEAFKIEDELKFYLPELETYVLFKTPNWRLVVGNYRTQEEATAALRVLKKKFPIYGREMFVVNDDIEIPLAK